MSELFTILAVNVEALCLSHLLLVVERERAACVNRNGDKYRN